MVNTTDVPSVGWLKGAATDDRGYWDAAYIGVLVLTALVAVTAMFEMLMIAVTWSSVKTYDPQPLGIAVAAVCGGFATALGALAGYQAASRPHGGDHD